MANVSSSFPNRPFRLRAETWVDSQNTVTNKSGLIFQVWVDKLGTSPSFSNDASSEWEFWAGGTKRGGATGLKFDFTGAGPWLLGQGYYEIDHDADGSKSIGLAVVGRYLILGNTQGDAVMALPSIARASVATFTGGSSLTAGAAVTVQTNRAVDTWTHDITWQFGSATGTIGAAVGASVSWTPPLSMLEQIPNGTSGSGFIRVVTKNGSTVIGTRDTAFTLHAGAEVVPTIPNITAADDNATVSSVVGAYVQGLSSIRATVNAQGVHGSTITQRSFSVDGMTSPSGGSIALNAAGARQVTAEATDSRGRKGVFSANINVLAYAPPLVTTATVKRCTAAGVLDENGTSLRVDLAAAVQSLINGTQRNTMTIRAFTRPRGGTAWTARNVINHGSLTYGSSFVISGGANYPVNASFEVRVEVADKFVTAIALADVATSEVYMHWAAQGVGIGKYWERGGLDVLGTVYAEGLQLLAGATDAETALGLIRTRAVTPASLAARVATETRTGLAAIATQAQVNTGTDDATFVTPKKLAALDGTWTNLTMSAAYATALDGITTAVKVVGKTAWLRVSVGASIPTGLSFITSALPAAMRPDAGLGIVRVPVALTNDFTGWLSIYPVGHPNAGQIGLQNATGAPRAWASTVVQYPLT